jgi:hypothetical protein
MSELLKDTPEKAEDTRLLSEREYTGGEIFDRALDDIAQVQEKVSKGLGLEFDSPKAVAATDEALVHIAGETIDSGASKDETRSTVEDVLIEGALEAVGNKRSSAENPIIMLEQAGYGDDLTKVVYGLHEARVELPNHQEIADVVAREIEKLSEHPVMAENIRGVEYIPSKKEGVEGALERAETLAEAGIEKSDFRGPEVREAIKGYYTDHEVTLQMVGDIVRGAAAEDEVEKALATRDGSFTIGNEQLREAIRVLADLDQSQKINERNEFAETVLDTLYREPCIGQLTLDEDVINRVAREKAQLMLAVSWRARRYFSIEQCQEEEARKIRSAEKSTINETRHAGQLLFHNTVYGHDMGWNGSLRGRHRQRNTQDKVSITTVDLPGHARLPHWSELYDPIGYKQPQENNRLVESMQALTVAVPLGEIVKQAPFGRGLEYAVVEAKDDHDVAALLVGSEGGSVVGEIGPGAADNMGAGLASIDRVFWASNDDPDTGADYDVPILGADIMRMDDTQGFEVPVVYQIQSDSDRLRNYNRAARDKDRVDGIRTDMATYSQRELLHEHGSAVNSVGAGMGFGHPNRVSIEDVSLDTDSPAIDWVDGGASLALKGGERGINRSEQARAAEEPIRKIQQESVDRFKNEYVVPLRAISTKLGGMGDNSVRNQYGEKLEYSLRKFS